MKKKDIEDIALQWKRERPDIDSTPMLVCGEIWRSAETLKKGVGNNLKRYELDFPMFDVLLTLRRQGKKSALTPSELSAEMMLSTSAMTNRLDKLQKRELIKRIHDAQDRRSIKIMLTPKGYDLADEIVGTHVQTEEDLLKNLSQSERDLLRSLLHKI